MKSINKKIVILLAVIMTFSMTLSAYATTVTKPAGDTTHTYSIYQIMTGTVLGTTITNAKWGVNVNTAKGTTGATVPTSDLNTIKATAGGTNREILDVIETYVDTTGAAFATVAANGTVTYSTGSSLPAGYYLVADTTSLDTTDNIADSKNLYVVKVTDGTTLEIASKREVPTLEKKVKQNATKDSTDISTANAFGDMADYNLTDDIDFTIKATLPSNFEDYKSYKCTFNDTMAGLKYKNGMQIEVFTSAGVSRGVINPAELTGVPAADDTSFNVDVADLRNGVSVTTDGVNYSDINLASTDYLLMSYTCNFDTATVQYNAANINTASLSYSSDPNAVDGGTLDNTPEDKVAVFTYKIKLLKVDGTNTPITSGVKFYIQNNAGEYAQADASSKITGWGAEAAATQFTTNASGEFEVNGLDEGVYTVTEIAAPTGYVKINPFTVTISAGVEADATSVFALNSFTATSSDTTNVAIVEPGDYSYLTVKVTNISTSSLPTTGGIGRTIFYAVGGLMMLISLILLVVKKRVNNA